MKNQLIKIIFLLSAILSFKKTEANFFVKRFFDTKKCELVYSSFNDKLTKIAVYCDVDSGNSLFYEYKVSVDGDKLSYAIPELTQAQKEKLVLTILLYTSERSSAVYYFKVYPKDWISKRRIWVKQERS